MKRFLSVVLILAMVVSFTACGGGASKAPAQGGDTTSGSAAAPAKAEFNLKFGHQLSESHPYQMAAEYMAKLIEERSNGRIHIDVFPSSQLGSERELCEGIQLGTVDLALATGPMASFDSDFYINDLPNLFTSKEHAYRVLDGEIGQQMLDGLDKVNMKGLTYWETGWLCMFNSKRLIKTPEDLKGLNLRTMQNQTYIDYFTALGCNPVPMAYSEYFTSVENGTVDGTLSPIVTIYTDKTYETAPYITRSYQWYCPAVLLMNVKVWNELGPELQEIVLTAAKEARDFERQKLAELEEADAQKIIDAGGQITDVDQNIWQNQDKAINAAWSSVVPSKVPQELIDKIEALADK